MGGKVRHISRIWPPGDVTDLFDTRLTVKLSPSLALAEMGIKKASEAPALLQEEPTLYCERNGAFSVKTMKGNFFFSTAAECP